MRTPTNFILDKEKLPIMEHNPGRYCCAEDLILRTIYNKGRNRANSSLIPILMFAHRQSIMELMASMRLASSVNFRQQSVDSKNIRPCGEDAETIPSARPHKLLSE